MNGFFDTADVLHEHNLRIFVGRNPDFEDQIIKKSTEPHILEHTPKDAEVRFANKQVINAWFEKKPETHWLVSTSGDIAGIIWYRQQTIPDTARQAGETFAIRLYTGYQGKGLARPFMEQSLQIHVNGNDRVLPIWLQTDTDNTPALTAYEKFGYEKINEKDGRITMILSVAKQLAIAIPKQNNHS
jgi:ribosomal protein S18 acetylase RimI-like enzyme